MGAQLLLISFATRLHGICNGSNNGMEDGGREHTCHSLGTGDKCTHPKFPSFVWDWEGKQQCFSSPTRLQEILKSHHLQAPVTLAALCVPTPTSTFFSAVIRGGVIVLTAFGGGLVSLNPPPPPPPVSGTVYDRKI